MTITKHFQSVLAAHVEIHGYQGLKSIGLSYIHIAKMIQGKAYPKLDTYEKIMKYIREV